MKQYVKPELYYEDFQLSTSIAVCAFDMNMSDKNSCVAVGDPEYVDPEIMLYIDGNVCNITQVEDYCYQPGADAYRVFNS